MMSRLGSCCMAGDWFGMPESLSFHYAGMADFNYDDIPRVCSFGDICCILKSLLVNYDGIPDLIITASRIPWQLISLNYCLVRVFLFGSELS